MRYFIIAGEASGDIYGGELIRGIRQRDTEAEIQFYGGDNMAAEAGHPPLVHIKELAIMGFWEVLVRAFSLLASLRKCRSQISKFKPDAIIYIDYGGFNLRMARWAKRNGFTCFYYIAPKTWAWKEGRNESIRKYIDHVYAILPFEEEYFASHDISVSYHGHPLKDVIKRHSSSLSRQEKYTIALLPGSRAQEINRMLPTFLSVAEKYPDWQFFLAKAPSTQDKWYDKYLKEYNTDNLTILEDMTYDILDVSDMALVASGTATLETALFNTPQVVCYSGNPISIAIARWLVKLDFFSLVNLILQGEAVTELLQEEMTVENICREIERLRQDNALQALQKDYDELATMLQPDDSSELIVKDLMQRIKP